MSTWRVTASRRLPAYLALGGAGLLAGLLLGRPEPVVVAAPLLLAAAAGLALARPPRLEVRVALDRERAVEGEDVEIEVEVRAPRLVDRLEVELLLPRGLAARRVPGGPPGGVGPGASRTYRWRGRRGGGGGAPGGGGRPRARGPG